MNSKTTEQWKAICVSIIGLSLMTQVSLAAATPWSDSTVDVKSDQPVATTQNLKKQKDGFQRLAITLSNQGKQPLKIEKITVHIPVAETLTDDLEMVYGRFAQPAAVPVRGAATEPDVPEHDRL